MTAWRLHSASLGVLILVAVVGVLMIVPAGSALSAGVGTASAAAPAVTQVSDASASSTHATTATTPTASLTPTTSSLSPSSILAGLPANLRSVPWIASLTHQGPQLQPLTSLPNLELLKDPSAAFKDGTINPFYVSQPAPIGVTDFGLGATPYSYNTSHVMGQITFQTPPNVTDPGSTGVIEPAGQHDGYVGTPYEFGIQLNTVATNISIPGSDQGFFWTQNVVNWNDSGIHFVDDTFNLTSATQNPYYIAAGTIYEACNNHTAGINKILYNYGGVFQCVGGTIPLTPASYPVTIQLYNNATVNAQDRTVVSYGYRIIMAGTGLVYTGVSDAVVFNSPGAADHQAPANPPGFCVDAFSPSPAGLFCDSELDMVGNIGGDTSVFRSMDATINLEYSNLTSGGWQNVPSAYNFGGDTGENSAGIAETWSPSHTVTAVAGPTMLYGLWNAVPYASVPSGAIQLSGTISPGYGFVFVSNTAPVLDPGNASLGERDNMSWLPTTNSGSFSTWLPPTGGDWTSAYYVQAFADGYAEYNGTTVSATDTSYTIAMTKSPGTLNAPLYAFSNAQATALAKAVTGSGTTPYEFSDLTVNMNFTFEHVDDYGYPEFEVFMAQGVTNPIYVSNVYQGTDSGAGNFVFTDYSVPTEQGLLVPGPFVVSPAPYFTSQINIYDGVHDAIGDQTTAADGYGLGIVLWQDRSVTVSDITSVLYSSGVWVGDSLHTYVDGVYAAEGATGVTDIGSSYTTAFNIDAVGALGVGALSVAHGSYDYISVDEGAGVEIGEDYGIEADYDAYYYLPGAVDTSVYVVSAIDDSLGVNISLSQNVFVEGVTANYASVAVELDNVQGASVSYVSVHYESYGVFIYHSTDVEATQVAARSHSVGVWTDKSTDIVISHVLGSRYSIDVIKESSHDVSISHLRTYDNSIAVYVIS